MANDKNFVVKNGLNIGSVFTAGNTTITGDASVSANLTSNNIIITNSVTSGTWAATIIAGQYGGTGVNNSGKTITLGGNLTTNGAYATVLTTTAATSVTLPTTGTLSTLVGTETLTNKTFTDSLTFFQDDVDNTKKVQFQLSSITASNTRTLTVQDASGTLALTSNKLSAFAATTSLELAGVISDETGAGYLVFNTTPTFATSVDSGASFNAWASATTLTEGYTGTAASTMNLSTGSVASATTKTINIGTGGASGSITNINFGSGISGATGTATFNNDVVITGLLTVNGTTVTLNSTTITVDDKNIELGSIASANNTTADGGGLTLKGLTDKTINWINATGAWTSSEDFDLVAGKSYKINNILVANSISLGSTVVGSSLTSVGTIATGVWQGTLVAGQWGGTGANNAGKTITLGGNLTTNGAFATVLTTTAATSVTLPTSGTLATLAGSETLTNKTLTAAVMSGNTVFNTDTLFIDSTNGRVGIGTVSPATKLHVQGFASYRGDAYTIASFSANATLAPLNITQSTDGTSPTISAGQNSGGVWSAIGFTTSNLERMRIQSDGNVGIGTTTPLTATNYRFVTVKGGTSGGGYSLFNSSGADIARLQTDATSGVSLYNYSATLPTIFVTNGNERMRIEASGNILAGSSSTNITYSIGGDIYMPAATTESRSIQIGNGRTGNAFAYIDLVGDATYTDYGFRILRGNTGANAPSGISHRGTGDFYLTAEDAGAITFNTSGIERMRIASTGTITVPYINVSASVPYIQLSDTDATGDWRVLVNSGVFVLQSSTDTYGSNKMTVTSAGALTMLGDVTAFSDERLKTNIRTIDNALDKVSAMRGVYFDKDGRSSTGVVAQEIEKVLPEVVHDGEYKSVAYGNIVGVLIEAIKELQAKVDKLEKRI